MSRGKTILSASKMVNQAMNVTSKEQLKHAHKKSQPYQSEYSALSDCKMEYVRNWLTDVVTAHEKSSLDTYLSPEQHQHEQLQPVTDLKISAEHQQPVTDLETTNQLSTVDTYLSPEQHLQLVQTLPDDAVDEQSEWGVVQIKGVSFEIERSSSGEEFVYTNET